MPGCRMPSIILGIAAILSLLVSISSPNIRAFDDVRTVFGGNIAGSSGVSNSITQVRYGIWGFCYRAAQNGNWICDNTGVGYSYAIQDSNGRAEYITASWTRGLVLSAVATGFAFITFFLSFTKHHFVTALLAWWSAFVTLLFMAVNIAFYVYVRAKMRHLNTTQNTDFGPGFWMALATFILLSSGGFAALIERRRSVGEYNENLRYGARPGLVGRIFGRK